MNKNENKEVQKIVFTKWFNNKLKKNFQPVLESLEDGFKSGRRFYSIINVICDTNNSSIPEQLSDHDMIEKGLQKIIQKLKFDIPENVTATNLIDCNESAILNLCWSLIVAYFKRQEYQDGENDDLISDLLRWCQTNTKEYERIDISNFTISWRDGLALLAILHRQKPDSFDYTRHLSKTSGQNLSWGIHICCQVYGCIRLLEIENFSSSFKMDWKSCCLFLLELRQNIRLEKQNCQQQTPNEESEEVIIENKEPKSFNQPTNSESSFEQTINNFKLENSKMTNNLTQITQKMEVASVRVSHLEPIGDQVHLALEMFESNKDLLTQFIMLKDSVMEHESLMEELASYQESVHKILMSGNSEILDTASIHNTDSVKQFIKLQLAQLTEQWNNVFSESTEFRRKLHRMINTIQLAVLMKVEDCIDDLSDIRDKNQSIGSSIEDVKEQLKINREMEMKIELYENIISILPDFLIFSDEDEDSSDDDEDDEDNDASNFKQSNGKASPFSKERLKRMSRIMSDTTFESHIRDAVRNRWNDLVEWVHVRYMCLQKTLLSWRHFEEEMTTSLEWLEERVCTADQLARKSSRAQFAQFLDWSEARWGRVIAGLDKLGQKVKDGSGGEEGLVAALDTRLQAVVQEWEEASEKWRDLLDHWTAPDSKYSKKRAASYSDMSSDDCVLRRKLETVQAYSQKGQSASQTDVNVTQSNSYKHKFETEAEHIMSWLENSAERLELITLESLGAVAGVSITRPTIEQQRISVASVKQEMSDPSIQKRIFELKRMGKMYQKDLEKNGENSDEIEQLFDELDERWAYLENQLMKSQEKVICLELSSEIEHESHKLNSVKARVNQILKDIEASNDKLDFELIDQLIQSTASIRNQLLENRNQLKQISDNAVTTNDPSKMMAISGVNQEIIEGQLAEINQELNGDLDRIENAQIKLRNTRAIIELNLTETDSWINETIKILDHNLCLDKFDSVDTELEKTKIFKSDLVTHLKALQQVKQPDISSRRYKVLKELQKKAQSLSTRLENKLNFFHELSSNVTKWKTQVTELQSWLEEVESYLSELENQISELRRQENDIIDETLDATLEEIEAGLQDLDNMSPILQSIECCEQDIHAYIDNTLQNTMLSERQKLTDIFKELRERYETLKGVLFKSTEPLKRIQQVAVTTEECDLVDIAIEHTNFSTDDVSQEDILDDNQHRVDLKDEYSNDDDDDLSQQITLQEEIQDIIKSCRNELSKYSEINSSQEFKDFGVKLQDIKQLQNNLVVKLDQLYTFKSADQEYNRLKELYEQFKTEYEEQNERYEKSQNDLENFQVDLKKVEDKWMVRLDKAVKQSLSCNQLDVEELSESIDEIERAVDDYPESKINKLETRKYSLVNARVLQRSVSSEFDQVRQKTLKLKSTAGVHLTSLQQLLDQLQSVEKRMLDMNKWIVETTNMLNSRLVAEIVGSDVPDEYEELTKQFLSWEEFLTEIRELESGKKCLQGSAAANREATERLRLQRTKLESLMLPLKKLFNRFSRPGDFDPRLDNVKREINRINEQIYLLDIISFSPDDVKNCHTQANRFSKELQDLQSDLNYVYDLGKKLVEQKEIDNPDRMSSQLDNLKKRHTNLSQQTQEAAEKLKLAWPMIEELAHKKDVLDALLDGQEMKEYHDKRSRQKLGDELKEMSENLKQYMDYDSSEFVKELFDELYEDINKLDNLSVLKDHKADVKEKVIEKQIDTIYQAASKIVLSDEEDNDDEEETNDYIQNDNSHIQDVPYKLPNSNSITESSLANTPTLTSPTDQSSISNSTQEPIKTNNLPSSMITSASTPNISNTTEVVQVYNENAMMTNSLSSALNSTNTTNSTNVELLNSVHQEMRDYIHSVILFCQSNLGYSGGSNSNLAALSPSLNMSLAGGRHHVAITSLGELKSKISCIHETISENFQEHKLQLDQRLETLSAFIDTQDNWNEYEKLAKYWRDSIGKLNKRIDRLNEIYKRLNIADEAIKDHERDSSDKNKTRALRLLSQLEEEMSVNLNKDRLKLTSTGRMMSSSSNKHDPEFQQEQENVMETVLETDHTPGSVMKAVREQLKMVGRRLNSVRQGLDEARRDNLSNLADIIEDTEEHFTECTHTLSEVQYTLSNNNEYHSNNDVINLSFLVEAQKKRLGKYKQEYENHIPKWMENATKWQEFIDQLETLQNGLDNIDREIVSFSNYPESDCLDLKKQINSYEKTLIQLEKDGELLSSSCNDLDADFLREKLSTLRDRVTWCLESVRNSNNTNNIDRKPRKQAPLTQDHQQPLQNILSSAPIATKDEYFEDAHDDESADELKDGGQVYGSEYDSAEEASYQQELLNGNAPIIDNNNPNSTNNISKSYQETTTNTTTTQSTIKEALNYLSADTNNNNEDNTFENSQDSLSREEIEPITNNNNEDGEYMKHQLKVDEEPIPLSQGRENQELLEQWVVGTIQCIEITIPDQLKTITELDQRIIDITKLKKEALHKMAQLDPSLDSESLIESKYQDLLKVVDAKLNELTTIKVEYNHIQEQLKNIDSALIVYDTSNNYNFDKSELSDSNIRHITEIIRQMPSGLSNQLDDDFQLIYKSVCELFERRKQEELVKEADLKQRQEYINQLAMLLKKINTSMINWRVNLNDLEEIEDCLNDIEMHKEDLIQNRETLNYISQPPYYDTTNMLNTSQYSNNTESSSSSPLLLDSNYIFTIEKINQLWDNTEKKLNQRQDEVYRIHETKSRLDEIEKSLTHWMEESSKQLDALLSRETGGSIKRNLLSLEDIKTAIPNWQQNLNEYQSLSCELTSNYTSDQCDEVNKALEEMNRKWSNIMTKIANCTRELNQPQQPTHSSTRHKTAGENLISTSNVATNQHETLEEILVSTKQQMMQQHSGSSNIDTNTTNSSVSSSNTAPQQPHKMVNIERFSGWLSSLEGQLESIELGINRWRSGAANGPANVPSDKLRNKLIAQLNELKTEVTTHEIQFQKCSEIEVTGDSKYQISARWKHLKEKYLEMRHHLESGVTTDSEGQNLLTRLRLLNDWLAHKDAELTELRTSNSITGCGESYNSVMVQIQRLDSLRAELDGYRSRVEEAVEQAQIRAGVTGTIDNHQNFMESEGESDNSDTGSGNNPTDDKTKRLIRRIRRHSHHLRKRWIELNMRMTEVGDEIRKRLKILKTIDITIKECHQLLAELEFHIDSWTKVTNVRADTIQTEINKTKSLLQSTQPVIEKVSIMETQKIHLQKLNQHQHNQQHHGNQNSNSLTSNKVDVNQDVKKEINLINSRITTIKSHCDQRIKQLHQLDSQFSTNAPTNKDQHQQPMETSAPSTSKSKHTSSSSAASSTNKQRMNFPTSLAENQNFIELKNESVSYPWERCLHPSGSQVPYYKNHSTQDTQWDHPVMSELTRSFEEFNSIKFSAYRTAMKLRGLQKLLCFDIIDLPVVLDTFRLCGLTSSSVNERLLDVNQIVVFLGSLYKAVNKAQSNSTNNNTSDAQSGVTNENRSRRQPITANNQSESSTHHGHSILGVCAASRGSLRRSSRQQQTNRKPTKQPYNRSSSFAGQGAEGGDEKSSADPKSSTLATTSSSNPSTSAALIGSQATIMRCSALANLPSTRNLNSNTNTHEVIIPITTDLGLNWLLNVFDRPRNGKIRVLSLKVAMVVMSKASLEEKYKHLFSLIATSSGHVDSTKLTALLTDSVLIPKLFNESISTDNIEQNIASLFKNNVSDCPTSSGVRHVRINHFLNWLRLEPQTLVWLPVLHRLISAEQSVHQARCGVCKIQPIVGLRYRCLRCFNFDLCQACFFYSKTAKSHKVSHPMQEYCNITSSKENIRDYSRIFRNRFRSKSRLRESNKQPSSTTDTNNQYNNQSSNNSSAVKSRSNSSHEPPAIDLLGLNSSATNKQLHSKLEQYATRLAEVEQLNSHTTNSPNSSGNVNPTTNSLTRRQTTPLSSSNTGTKYNTMSGGILPNIQITGHQQSLQMTLPNNASHYHSGAPIKSSHHHHHPQNLTNHTSGNINFDMNSSRTPRLSNEYDKNEEEHRLIAEYTNTLRSQSRNESILPTTSLSGTLSGLNNNQQTIIEPLMMASTQSMRQNSHPHQSSSRYQSNSSMTTVGANTTPATVRNSDGSLNRIIQGLEIQKRQLLAEFDRLHNNRSVGCSPAVMQQPSNPLQTSSANTQLQQPPNYNNLAMPPRASSTSGSIEGDNSEARLLRHHKGRLEARMGMLEQHNRQLEAQLIRLRQMLAISVGATDNPAGARGGSTSSIHRLLDYTVSGDDPDNQMTAAQFAAARRMADISSPMNYENTGTRYNDILAQQEFSPRNPGGYNSGLYTPTPAPRFSSNTGMSGSGNQNYYGSLERSSGAAMLNNPYYYSSRGNSSNMGTPGVIHKPPAIYQAPYQAQQYSGGNHQNSANMYGGMQGMGMNAGPTNSSSVGGSVGRSSGLAMLRSAASDNSTSGSLLDASSNMANIDMMDDYRQFHGNQIPQQPQHSPGSNRLNAGSLNDSCPAVSTATQGSSSNITNLFQMAGQVGKAVGQLVNVMSDDTDNPTPTSTQQYHHNQVSTNNASINNEDLILPTSYSINNNVNINNNNCNSNANVNNNNSDQ